ncbi:MAG: hypothetical protein H0U00_06815 [Actinobacteria bacterium]|nr:hypothetical protein [Actinomycetota bacterium]
MIRDWPGERQARELRHWLTFVYLAERVARSEHLDALIVIGSFATVQADEAGDLDLLIAVSEGRFPEAWDRRTELETRDALVAWDFRPEPHKPIGTRTFLTRDMIKVELQLSGPSAAGAVLAEPRHVLIGEESITKRYAQLEPIPPEVLSEYAQRIRDEGLVPEVESRYGELMEAIGRAR